MPLWLTLRQLKQRQPNVSRQRLRWRRLQQLRDKLQSNEAGNSYEGSLSYKLPANA
jgi:hypothetical protein